MKKLIFLSLLIPSLSFAGDIRIMRIVPNGALYDITTWGQKDLGEPTQYKLKLGDPALDKVISLVADQTGSKQFVRCVVYFDDSVTLSKIDVQTVASKAFDQNVKVSSSVDGKSQTDISDIKTDLQSK